MMENNDKVQHPLHYNRKGAIECFDEFLLIYGKEAAMHACLFNIHKYRYRAADKNGEVDLEKSDWYMKKYIELCDEKTSKKSSAVSAIEWEPGGATKAGMVYLN